jgi:hypothetical protein
MRIYEETGNVFELVGDFHRRLKQRYRQLKDRTERKRVRLLLEYLSRHQERYQKALERFGRKGRENLSKTWYQYIPDDEKLTVQDISLSADMNVNQLVTAALTMDERLVEFYRMMAENAGSPPEVQELFTSLAEQEEREKAKLSETAERIKHL